ncbi:iron chelate uptake ABC transporter family permease subunit [Hydrogenovibrio sp. 3SP14C1]|uniref:iron chelate uptake ABC transporter family permease subunit n=1 Tax=Hydrogenovibrio sp. 3SP14C1 TaxID=3038774 RepID=UPI0024168254|nr:iron chelate uptake ABC transporter family permease subunit [Hydrogenovibrio sp. 3SP14C1]MDG4811812.1 iron chelate uptake ABC transporter family permease subunit [Hydrogenovibrio sp. 3SP14C1]
MIDWLLNPPLFLLLALLGGVLIALIAAPLGVFMVWQKQSYFGAALAHSALLGVSFGLFIELNLTVAVVLISLAVALGIHFLKEKTRLSSDTLLGILAHSTLAIGLIMLSLQSQVQIDIFSYLFGDILSIDSTDLIFILLLGALVSLFFWFHWHDLLNATLNAELAQIEGVPTQKVQLYYVLLLALLIAVAMKIVGVLLITSLLIIPAAAARKFASSPERMLVFSIIFGLFSILFGLLGSILWDIPTGPSIVTVATLIFVVSLLKKENV